MIKEYLKYLKVNGNFSWHDISNASGLPEVTIRKIFSGETADPRFETVVRLVSAEVLISDLYSLFIVCALKRINQKLRYI